MNKVFCFLVLELLFVRTIQKKSSLSHLPTIWALIAFIFLVEDYDFIRKVDGCAKDIGLEYILETFCKKKNNILTVFYISRKICVKSLLK